MGFGIFFSLFLTVIILNQIFVLNKEIKLQSDFIHLQR
jgi:hypothetical protein